jgi:hypothetical protein
MIEIGVRPINYSAVFRLLGGFRGYALPLRADLLEHEH